MKIMARFAAIVLFGVSAVTLSGAPALAWGSWVVETHEYVDTAYTVRTFGYIAGGRDLRVVVRGNPTSASRRDFEQTALRIMNARQPGYQPQARFTSNATARSRESYKVVLVFGDRHVSESRACRDPGGVPATYRGGRVRLTAVFCWRDERINSVRSRVGAFDSIADPALGDMIASAMRGTFPNIWRIGP